MIYWKGKGKIEEFLIDLAVNKNVAPLTRNQAMNALVFSYKNVLKLPFDGPINEVILDLCSNPIGS